MTPTKLYSVLKESQSDFDVNKVANFKRLDSGAIEMKLKSGAKGVFRIDGKSHKRFLLVEWDANYTIPKERTDEEIFKEFLDELSYEQMNKLLAMLGDSIATDL